MNLFARHSNDARWLRRWLRSQLVCALAITGFLLLLRFQTPHPQSREARVNHANFDTFSSAPSESTELNEESLPPETDLRYLGARRPNPVSPTGWRRTDQGWEDVSTWRQITRPLGEIVMRQEAREPAWMTAALAKLRQVPPLGFALLQIAAISAIVGLSRGELRDEIKPTSVSR